MGFGLRAQVGGLFVEPGRTPYFVQGACLDCSKLKFHAAVDEFIRECLALKTATSIKASKVRSVLANLFDACGEPKYLRSDSGPEFVAHSLTVWLAMAGTQSRFIKPGSPCQNGFFDRFNGELRTEFLHSEVFHNLADGQLKVRLLSRFCNVQHPQLVPGICPTRSLQRELSSESNEGGTLLFKNVPQKGCRSVRESIAKYTAGPDILFLEWKYRGNWSKEYPVLRYGDNVPERWQVSSLSHGLREKHTAKLV